MVTSMVSSVPGGSAPITDTRSLFELDGLAVHRGDDVADLQLPVGRAARLDPGDDRTGARGRDVVAEAVQGLVGGGVLGVAHHLEVDLAVLLRRLRAEDLVARLHVDRRVDPGGEQLDRGGLAQRHREEVDVARCVEGLGALDADERLGGTGGAGAERVVRQLHQQAGGDQAHQHDTDDAGGPTGARRPATRRGGGSSPGSVVTSSSMVKGAPTR